MPVHCRVTPSIKFAVTHLHTWVERGTVSVRAQCNVPSQGLNLGKLQATALRQKSLILKHFLMWCALIHSMQCPLIHSKTTYLTYTEAPVLIQNISFLTNTSKTADGILTSAICTNAGDLGAFIHIWRKKAQENPWHQSSKNKGTKLSDDGGKYGAKRSTRLMEALQREAGSFFS